MYLFFLFFAIALAILAQILFKSFSLNITGFNRYFFLDIKLFLGLCLYFISALFYIVSLKQISLSVAYPTVAISYIAIIFLSHFIFGETLTAYKVFGCFFIALGVCLLWK